MKWKCLLGISLTLWLCGPANAAVVTYIIDSAANTSDADPTDGQCATSLFPFSSKCTHTAALQEVQAQVDAGSSDSFVVAFDTLAKPICLEAGINLTFTNAISFTGSSDGSTVISGGNEATDICTSSSPITDTLLTIKAGAHVSLEQITFSGASNYAGLLDTDYKGGALHIEDSQVGISACTFSENTVGMVGTSGKADALGGAIYAANSSSDTSLYVNISDSTFTQNVAAGSSSWAGQGGAIYANTQALFYILNSTFYDNAAYAANGSPAGGAIFAASTAQVYLSSLTIDENSACDLDLGATGSESTASFGGGIASSSGTPFSLANVLLTNNVATSASTSTDPGSCGSGATGSGPDCSAAITSLGHNLLSDKTSCTGFDDTNDETGSVSFHPLADNGGRTPTLAFDEILTYDILNGDCTIVNGLESASKDQRGAGRTVASCWIGAIEATGTEDCTDGFENNDDGLADCDDSQCDEYYFCGGTEISCTNGSDDDSDGLIDCSDTDDCSGIAICGGSEVLCNDENDNDLDGTQDCDDPDCGYLWICGGTETSCIDADDNDGDLTKDCDDIDCAATGACMASTTPETSCNNATDDDSDGSADCNDYDCVTDAACATETICDDDSDNDRDGFADCDDEDCSGTADCQESDCDDGLDNDADTLFDCDDSNCSDTSACDDDSSGGSGGGGSGGGSGGTTPAPSAEDPEETDPNSENNNVNGTKTGASGGCSLNAAIGHHNLAATLVLLILPLAVWRWKRF